MILVMSSMNGVGPVTMESVEFGNLNFTCAGTCPEGPFSSSIELMQLEFVYLYSSASGGWLLNSLCDLDYGLLSKLRLAC